jgi:hypothetical protein
MAAKRQLSMDSRLRENDVFQQFMLKLVSNGVGVCKQTSTRSCISSHVEI